MQRVSHRTTAELGLARRDAHDSPARAHSDGAARFAPTRYRAKKVPLPRGSKAGGGAALNRAAAARVTEASAHRRGHASRRLKPGFGRQTRPPTSRAERGNTHVVFPTFRGTNPAVLARFGPLSCALSAMAPVCCGAPQSPPAAPTGSTVPSQPVAFAGAEAVQPISSDVAFESLEGPLWVAPRGVLLFSDVVEQNGTAAKIYRYDPLKRTFSVEPYPASPTSTNGLGVDREGNLLVCERWNGALVRIADGRRTVLADRFPSGDAGALLSAPNDIVVRTDGNIYFTDTVWGAKPGPHAAQAVYRIAPDGTVTVADAVSMPNGVALSPDGRTLYVGSDAQNRVWKLQVDPAGAVGPATLLIDSTHVPAGQFKVPDGICIDDDGDLYVANNDDSVKAIEVFTPQGRYLGDIVLPDRPSNCTFGGADRRTLYITTLHAIYTARAATPGLP